jgi:hypothetical protein
MPEFMNQSREGGKGAEMGRTNQVRGTRMGHSSFCRRHQGDDVNRVKIGAETKRETRKSLVQLILKKRVIIGGDHIRMIGPFGTGDLISGIIVTARKISVHPFGML